MGCRHRPGCQSAEPIMSNRVTYIGLCACRAGAMHEKHEAWKGLLQVESRKWDTGGACIEPSP